jgi:hypothetical protein
MPPHLRTFYIFTPFGVAPASATTGGLAAYLHADYLGAAKTGLITALAPELQRFKVAPVSGFFLFHDSLVRHFVLIIALPVCFDYHRPYICCVERDALGYLRHLRNLQVA